MKKTIAAALVTASAAVGFIGWMLVKLSDAIESAGEMLE